MTEESDAFFKGVELLEDEQQIFHKLKECSIQLENHELRQNNREAWQELWNVGGALSFDMYKRLTSRGIDVKFNKDCLRNRSRDAGGPENEEFHNHIDVILGIVEFIEFKQAHDEIGDVTLNVTFNIQIFCKKRRSSEGFRGPTPISIKRIPEGWRCTVQEKVSEDGKRCSQFLDNLRYVEACIIPEISVLEDAFECLWDDAAEGMEPGILRKKLEDIANWISSTEKGRPDWI